MLIPSIDLYNGKAVQLRQGKELVLEREDVFELLTEYSLYGEVAIIDLNAALGEGDNRELITELLKLRRCRVGGGIRDLEAAQFYLKAGASKIILGTCCRDDFVKTLPREALIFAIDAKDDYWVTKGWKETQPITIKELIPELQDDCSEFLYTQVNKEGMLEGIDRLRVDAVIEQSSVPVTVAGGITSLEDIAWINQRGANSQIGMAIYTGRITLEDCLLACVDFTKAPLMPTVVQDVETGKVLMLAYSKEKSLRQAINTRKGTYYSRSRDEIWEKGLTSGNTQELRRIDYDCDGDTLLFQVKQTAGACHLARYSCFASQSNDFSLSRLDDILSSRQQSMPENSYTSKLFASEELQNEKLREECEELIEASNYVEVRWEAADLIFFALVNARAKGVGITAITDELRSRFNDR